MIFSQVWDILFLIPIAKDSLRIATRFTFGKLVGKLFVFNYGKYRNGEGIMLKKSLLIVLFLVPAFIFAQENSGFTEQDTPQKYALVIGNSSYTGLTPLANPLNDADDITAVLEYLGFNVDKVINGTMNEMEDGVLRLKDRLSEAENAYGFFFYAGHGVQAGGDNYLIPVDANIPNENYLRTRAVSVQTLLDDLNDARNGLNVVVLDACRDNPFGWSRSGTRGLSIVSRQPADSIIIYSTSAGQRASDGEGRNGLFTSQLISNLATPYIEVSEVFKRTGQDVARVSNNQQIPAIYSQFFGTAFLGEVPLDFEGYIIGGPGTTVIIGGKKVPQPAKFWSIGASVGSSFAAPWVIGTLQGTIAPFKYSFLEIGLDAGFVSGVSGVGYYSFCPFLHAAFFWPIINYKVGVYAGSGGGYMWADYKFSDVDAPLNTFAMDAVAGINLFDMLNISYTLRTNFKAVSNKVSVGYTYRFK